ncbi:hypothetical protein EPR50_G00071370 [Perca flavescens]|uniref:Uncharacterized protein n=1 Tax=Perca flavescens TaxID=8167 RepID=A0A484D4D4_PERFV|nr:hypothetical protein EPR50_G00071370 [Perca flavescens]
MCKVQMLRALVEQRLTAAAEEIFGLFERTIAEYEEELCRSKEENERQRELLDAVYNPQLRLHRAATGGGGPGIPFISTVGAQLTHEQVTCVCSMALRVAVPLSQTPSYRSEMIVWLRPCRGGHFD